MKTLRIGFVGTGSMGAPVAANLLAAGHHLRVHDLRLGAARELLTGGAAWAMTPAQAGADADVVFLSLPSHVEVAEVCFGAGGLFETIRPGTFLVDLSTGSVDAVARLVEAQRAYRIRYLACPVSQGTDNAAAGQLSIFAGGDRGDFEAIRPLLGALGSVIIYTGDQASAISAKLLTNLLWFINAVAIGEALVLGVKSGISLRVLQDVVLNSCGTSWVAEHDIPSIFDGSFDPSFSTALCVKDLALIAELADRHGVPLELGALVREVFERAQNRYGSDSPELSVVAMKQDDTNTSLQVASIDSGAETAGV